MSHACACASTPCPPPHPHNLPARKGACDALTGTAAAPLSWLRVGTGAHVRASWRRRRAGLAGSGRLRGSCASPTAPSRCSPRAAPSLWPPPASARRARLSRSTPCLPPWVAAGVAAGRGGLSQDLTSTAVSHIQHARRLLRRTAAPMTTANYYYSWSKGGKVTALQERGSGVKRH